jgi:hypothetical protein
MWVQWTNSRLLSGLDSSYGEESDCDKHKRRSSQRIGSLPKIATVLQNGKTLWQKVFAAWH